MISNTKEDSSDNDPANINKFADVGLRTLMAFVGIAILSSGTTLLREGNVGLDPFTAMNTGLAAKINTGLGNAQLMVNLIIFILILILDRKKIGIGTILNMTLVGYEIQWLSSAYKMILPNSINIFTTVANLIVGLLLFTLGSSLYMGANLGVAPYDAIAPIASIRLHIKYRSARITQDVLFMATAFFIGGAVGFATIIVAFFTGPLITYWDTHVSEKVKQGITNFSSTPSLSTAGKQLASVGKSSYYTVRRAYELTEQTQRQLSNYSNQELNDRIERTRNRSKQLGQVYENTQKQLRLLQGEADKRRNN
ncbi:YczE/YyaS/YitT family protein [Lentilactobacillus hilgardii]|uniref:Integral membrane protein n=1 Tax=Lentilactobacillus hilgardii (strain ATCC 8290 / DSM 20176 / CCUG 30140 / JCM 1155 / KCTC 3500 / NBRC 15886 / NCIMB 8040 / NRRL B-1843 / 9) TaxID=1423757 RepID=C0XGH9_LENH9|nr:membrane protein [Lentilactobacillus hilgardii]EEI25523.1 hypothetical protein HMPREF0519_0340 [Lentilactobacillus hilgardii DSM 20176 = ATCC 8290]KRK56624.1 hypothetical protein FD42_GL000312 [Lentilactobacillus hilgardii DSM 20176 = ATCC 8290]QEU39455.1 membrane protein [Lentilactobacillus hilgardii]TDG83774.1 hypothetical protein C5L34_000119 [Lentilactobacillus hilgardii]